jgi:NADH:ubiquinone oxidoreductase subunit H
VFWFFLKVLILLFATVWLRATLPRLRYDQLMSLGWKILLPLATLNVLVTAVLVVVSGIAAAMVLGGWHGPGPDWLGPIWMLAKIMVLICFFIWVRATLPRLRYDQLMSLGWKVLLPLATLNVLVTAVLVVVW